MSIKYEVGLTRTHAVIFGGDIATETFKAQDGLTGRDAAIDIIKRAVTRSLELKARNGAYVVYDDGFLKAAAHYGVSLA